MVDVVHLHPVWSVHNESVHTNCSGFASLANPAYGISARCGFLSSPFSLIQPIEKVCVDDCKKPVRKREELSIHGLTGRKPGN